MKRDKMAKVYHEQADQLLQAAIAAMHDTNPDEDRERYFYAQGVRDAVEHLFAEEPFPTFDDPYDGMRRARWLSDRKKAGLPDPVTVDMPWEVLVPPPGEVEPPLVQDDDCQWDVAELARRFELAPEEVLEAWRAWYYRRGNREIFLRARKLKRLQDRFGWSGEEVATFTLFMPGRQWEGYEPGQTREYKGFLYLKLDLSEDDPEDGAAWRQLGPVPDDYDGS